MNTLMKTPKLLPPSDNGQSLYYSSISQNKHIQWKGEKGYGRSESSVVSAEEGEQRYIWIKYA